VDVVISNCVIALSVDKVAVFGEIAHVLRPGGRTGITDILADDTLTDADRVQRSGKAECLAGALTHTDYGSLLGRSGSPTWRSIRRIRPGLPASPPFRPRELPFRGTHERQRLVRS
jgi:hypothetical protein